MGHVILDPRGRKCVCGKSGCLEAYCSATAIIKASKAAMLLNKDSAMWQLASGNLDNVNGKTPFDAKELGDKTASDVVEEFIDYLAVGVSNFINILQPDVVCIGGGISRQGDNLIKPLADKVECLSFGLRGSRSRVVAAKFKNEAGIIGAALLGLQEENHK
jgi:glucokinase